MADLSPEDITEGPLVRALVVLAAPLLVQNLVNVAQQVIDLFWVGRLSSEAVAAVGLAFPVVSLLFTLVVLAPFVGTQVLVSQRVGGGDTAGARRALFTGLLLTVVLGAVVGILGFLLARPLVSLLLGTRPAATAGAVPDLAAAYVGIIALGLPVLLLTDATEAGFVGWGDSRASLYLNLTALAVNAALDPLLIFGFTESPLFSLLGAEGLATSLFAATGFAGLGIEGAALATVVGYTVGGLLGLALVAAGRNGGMLSRAAARIDLGEVRELLDIGLPYAGQNLAKQGVDVVLVVVMFAAGGPAGLAAYAVGVRVASLAVIPAQGLGQAAQSVVGQNLGAGNADRARRTTWVGVAISVGGLGFLGLLQWALPGGIVAAVGPTLSGPASELAVEFLRVLAYGYPAIGAAYVIRAGFDGARRTRTSLAASLVQYWGVRLPIAAVFGVFLAGGASAVFWAVTVSNVAAALGLAAYYRLETENGMLSRAVEAAD